jgi:UDP-glucose 4-epimerase
MKITHAIITGSSGFIGRALVNELKRRGVAVTPVDIKPIDENDTETVKIDVSMPGSLDKHIEKDTVIFHMAAKASVSNSVDNPKEDFNSTLYGLFQVLETARKYNSRVIFPSTASVFDVDNKLPVSEKSYVKPSSPYGAAKVAGEAYCFAYHRCYGIDVRIARMFSVYGMGMDRFAIFDFIRKIHDDNKELILLGDGEQIRDYLYIDDAINGLIMIATEGSPGEDYNLASGQQVVLYDLAEKIAFMMGFKNIKITVTGVSSPGDVPRWYANINKIKNLGFKANISLDSGLKKTINWMGGDYEYDD